jgi:hypothetical protein
MRMKRAMAGLAAFGLLAGAGSAWATMPMQKKAKEAGFTEATSCLYCHTEKLPKKDNVALGDRGKWLVAEKDKRKAKEVDVSWLKDYVEKK